MLNPGDSFTQFRSNVDVTRTVERLDGMYVIFSISYSKPTHNCRDLTGQRLAMEVFMDWANKADKQEKAKK
jgi:hypothetical protein